MGTLTHAQPTSQSDQQMDGGSQPTISVSCSILNVKTHLPPLHKGPCWVLTLSMDILSLHPFFHTLSHPGALKPFTRRTQRLPLPWPGVWTERKASGGDRMHNGGAVLQNKASVWAGRRDQPRCPSRSREQPQTKQLGPSRGACGSE